MNSKKRPLLDSSGKSLSLVRIFFTGVGARRAARRFRGAEPGEGSGVGGFELMGEKQFEKSTGIDGGYAGRGIRYTIPE